MRTNAVDRRERSGQTIAERWTHLGNRVAQLVTHFPEHGLALLQTCEELADSTEFKLGGAKAILVALSSLLLLGALGAC